MPDRSSREKLFNCPASATATTTRYYYYAAAVVATVLSSLVVCTPPFLCSKTTPVTTTPPPKTARTIFKADFFVANGGSSHAERWVYGRDLSIATIYFRFVVCAPLVSCDEGETVS